MNMEQLNKSQIVLLTLLISFVTSIATGIVTVSLMDQAPPVIAQTVNRVIERTIETVVPASQSAATTVTRERTVVVRESELISQAVARVSPSVVRLYSSTSLEAEFLGFGVILSAEGAIVSDTAAIDDLKEVVVALPDGVRVPASVTDSDKEIGLAFLQATLATTTIALRPAVIAGSSPLLGQSVVMFSGKSILRVEDGIVTALIPMEGGESAKGVIVDTNISSDLIVAGSPLMNTDGEIIGVSTAISRASSPEGFIASSVLVKQPVEEEKTKTE